MSPWLEGTARVLELASGIIVELIDGVGIVVIVAGVVIILSMVGNGIYRTLKSILNGKK